MSCSSCTLTKKIPLCADSLEIGLITPDTEVILYFENLATNRVDFTTATSDADGILTADLTELSFAAKQAYTLHVVAADINSIETPLNVTIGDVEHDCFQIEFVRIMDGDSIHNYTDITLEVYE